MNRKKQIKEGRLAPSHEKVDIEVEIHGESFVPLQGNKDQGHGRDENPVVYMDISTKGGRRDKKTGTVSQPRKLGRLHFELRMDLCPMTCNNFMSILNNNGFSTHDGIEYSYKNTEIHRIVKNRIFEGGDLLGKKGECSRSIYNNGGLFVDENFIFRHAGPGCLSMCNRGPNTNGSLFQVTFTKQETFDEKYVVFGCCASEESFTTLEIINTFGSPGGQPLEELYISETGQSYPI